MPHAPFRIAFGHAVRNAAVALTIAAVALVAFCEPAAAALDLGAPIPPVGTGMIGAGLIGGGAWLVRRLRGRHQGE